MVIMVEVWEGRCKKEPPRVSPVGTVECGEQGWRPKEKVGVWSSELDVSLPLQLALTWMGECRMQNFQVCV